MKLYPRKLNSLEELKREKHVLNYAKKQTAAKSWFDLDSLKPKGTDKLFNAGMIGSLLSALGSKSVFGTVITLAPTILKLVSKRSGKKNLIETFAKDVVASYLKWKTATLIFGTLKRLLTGGTRKKPGSAKR